MDLNTTALQQYLQPLEAFLYDAEVSEILINQPNVAHVERHGELKAYALPDLNYRHLSGLAGLMARYTNQRLSEQEPLLSATLPAGHRIQIVLPPAARYITIAIRKQVLQDLALEELAARGVFAHTQPFYMDTPKRATRADELATLWKQGRYCDFLQHAVATKKTLLIAGATSTGKTTFLNACLKAIPMQEHLVTLEDVAELHPPHPLHTALFSSKGLQGSARVTMQDLIQASLRLRPDRIILGELRGAEAADFIHATATGHDGSLASLHASDPKVAFMRLVHMVKLNAHMNLSRADILEDLHTVVDIVVQLERRRVKETYQRQVTSIYYNEGA